MQCLNSRHPQTEMRKQNQKIIKAWKLLNWNFIYCHKNEEFYDVMRNSICKLGRQFVLKTWPIDGQHVLIPVFTRWTYNNDQNDHDPAENSHFKLTYTNDFFFGFSGVFFFLSFATTKNGLWIGLHNFYSNVGFLSFSIVFLWYSVPQSYVYGSPYLGAATTAGTGLVPIQATQLSHAAAIAAATNQFYEYQVSL